MRDCGMCAGMVMMAFMGRERADGVDEIPTPYYSYFYV